MNKVNDRLVSIFETIKSDICNLVEYRARGETIEIITQFTTLNNCVVSVFLSVKEDKIIVSDGGWLHRDKYNDQGLVDELSIVTRINTQLIEYYKIKQTQSKQNINYFYKTTNKKELVSSLVLELSQFIVASVNSRILSYSKEEDVNDSKKAFHDQVNGYIKSLFRDVETNEYIKVNEQYRVKFDCIFRIKVRPFLLMYISGSNNSVFNKDISQAVVNFNVVNRNAVADEYFTKIAILNTQAPGYNKAKSDFYLAELREAADMPLIDYFNPAELTLIENLRPKTA
ncbi:hypothetical protein ACS5NO_07610 [Larkinella sp. GY13]|uniref:hypothetical protein n=1 Tax=Larkinella sp. GY13 TaxID=3453720 RepID=UPI003EEBDEDD